MPFVAPAHAHHGHCSSLRSPYRIIAFFSYSVTSSLPSFALERAIIDKELRNGMYSSASYVISNALVQLPFVFLTTLVASVTAYFLVRRGR